MTWSDAQEQCQNAVLPKAGGELASVPDKATNDFLEKALIVKRLGLGLGTWDLGPGTWDLGPGT